MVAASRRDPSRPIDLQTVFRSSGDEPLQEQLVRCRSCGLVYVCPRLKWELILEGYRGGSDETFVSQVAFRERTFARCLDKIEASARPPGRRVLDVGAAGGSFLAIAARRGYEPAGCEPSTWMCGYAKQHYGLDLHPGTLFEIDRAPGSVDLLTLFDVIEHTPDPKAAIRRAHELLAPGGVLAITYPDYASLAARAMGSRWVFLLTVHLYYFEPATMRRLLESCGFDVGRCSPHFQTLELGYVFQRAAPYLGRLGAWLERAVRSSGLGRLPFHYWVGQTMVVATKR